MCIFYCPTVTPASLLRMSPVFWKLLRDWRTVSGVLHVPGSRNQIIETTFSTETARRQAAVDWWLRYSPTASWTWLAGQLYWLEERTALKAVSQYIHKETAGTDNFLTSYSCSSIHSPQCHCESFRMASVVKKTVLIKFQLNNN